MPAGNVSTPAPRPLAAPRPLLRGFFMLDRAPMLRGSWVVPFAGRIIPGHAAQLIFQAHKLTDPGPHATRLSTIYMDIVCNLERSLLPPTQKKRTKAILNG